MYGCEVSRQDHLVRKDGGKYDAVEYEEHPERYISVFAHKVRKKISLVYPVYFPVSLSLSFNLFIYLSFVSNSLRSCCLNMYILYLLIHYISFRCILLTIHIV